MDGLANGLDGQRTRTNGQGLRLCPSANGQWLGTIERDSAEP